MQCNCNSKNLYKNYQSKSFKIDQQELPQTRTITLKQPTNPQQNQLLTSIYSSSQIYLPLTIDKISIDELYTNPLWFYKQYIAGNKPCILVDGLVGEIVESWSNPKQFIAVTEEEKGMEGSSVSLTPDGFADSVKNKYFIQPLEIKAKIRDVIEWKQQQKQNKLINSSWIPYIQHQNSNLTKQLNYLTKFIDQDMKNFVSQSFFQGNQPDASNFWMGYENSVSALHKDHYQNFYTTIVGQKHFTLLPPISIAYLHEQTYNTAKWSLDQQKNQFIAKTQAVSQYETTRWITCNPDLQSDLQLFPQLSNLKDCHHHIILQAGQTLYLPALWYHQVSQTHDHSPYTIAINYWFDMSFNHNYSLYQAVRKIKNYP